MRSRTQIDGDPLVSFFARIRDSEKHVVVHPHQEVVESVCVRLQKLGFRRTTRIERSKTTREWYAWVRRKEA